MTIVNVYFRKYGSFEKLFSFVEQKQKKVETFEESRMHELKLLCCLSRSKIQTNSFNAYYDFCFVDAEICQRKPCLSLITDNIKFNKQTKLTKMAPKNNAHYHSYKLGFGCINYSSLINGRKRNSFPAPSISVLSF